MSKGLILVLLGLFAGLPMPAQEGAPPPAPPPEQVSLGDLVEQLGSGEFAVRSEATERLREHGEAARKFLEVAAQDQNNLERKTRAAMLLRELDEAASARSGPRRPVEPLRPVGPSEVRPQERPSVELGRIPRVEEFKDVREYFEALQRYLDHERESIFTAPGLLRPFGGGFRVFGAPGQEYVFRFGGGPGSTSVTRTQVREGEVLELTRTEDGRVVLKVERKDPAGKSGSQVETYEAPDLESLRAQHPEIYERYRDTGLLNEPRNHFRFEINPLEGFLGEPPGSLPDRPAAPEEEGGGLGILVEPVPDVLRAHIEIPPRALLVREVEPASMAAGMGLRPFDVLTHIDGVPVGAADEIRSLLAAAGASPELHVRVLRRGQVLNLKGPRPRLR